MKMENKAANRKAGYRPFEYGFADEPKPTHRIRVIGVGGCGGNAVKALYEKGVSNMDLVVCDTDSQALSQCVAHTKLRLSTSGLGVGGDPELGRSCAEENLYAIRELFAGGPKMVFIMAGMGGGTGMGAAPVIARVAREVTRDFGILIIGVVTSPFFFELSTRIDRAQEGIELLRKEVDLLLVIGNEYLLKAYTDDVTTIEQTFLKVDDVMATTLIRITELAKKDSHWQLDLDDMSVALRKGGRTILSVGVGRGEHRHMEAIQEALSFPEFSKIDMTKIRRFLLAVYTDELPEDVDTLVPLMKEIHDICDYLEGFCEDTEIRWGLYKEDTLKDAFKVVIMATDFGETPYDPDEELEELDDPELVEFIKFCKIHE